MTRLLALSVTRMTLVVAVALLALVIDSPRDSSAHSGDVFVSTLGTATIDGVQAAREWDTATQIPVFGGVVGDLPGSTLFIMNDATDVYFGLSVTDTTLSDSDAFEIRFDNDHNGTIDDGDDELSFTVDPLFGFTDTHFEGSPVSSYGILDAEQDGSGSAGDAGATNFFEVSHPLNSGNPDDIGIAGGDTLGFCVRYFLDGVATSPGTDFPSSCPLVASDQSIYAHLTVLPGPTGIEVKKTADFDGRFVSGIISITNVGENPALISAMADSLEVMFPRMRGFTPPPLPEGSTRNWLKVADVPVAGPGLIPVGATVNIEYIFDLCDAADFSGARAMRNVVAVTLANKPENAQTDTDVGRSEAFEPGVPVCPPQ